MQFLDHLPLPPYRNKKQGNPPHPIRYPDGSGSVVLEARDHRDVPNLCIKMVRTPCCEKMGLKKGPWTPDEDQILTGYIQRYGHGNWRALPKQAGLLRCGKSCRLRWINYLRPDIKRGNFSEDEEETIVKLHQILGNRWSAIAARLPGRTDNEIKNYWHSRLKKRLQHTSATQTSSVSTQQRIHSPGNYTSNSQQQMSQELSSTATAVKNPVVVEQGVHYPFSAISTRENMGTNTSSIKEDMDFWYNLFTKAGDQGERT